jgi:hypothetical protein
MSWPAATARSSEVDTTEDDQAVAVSLPAPTRRRSRSTAGVLEESGWLVEVTGVFGVYSDPRTQMHVYPSGNRVHFVGVVFTATATESVGRADDEVTEVGFFDRYDLPQPLFAPDHPVLMDFVSRRDTPVIA